MTDEYTLIPKISTLDKYKKPKKLLKFVDGVPVPYTDMVLPKNQLDNVLLAAMSLPYTGTYCPIQKDMVLEEEYCGLTNIEVAAIKTAKKAASGQTEDLRFVMERLLGKPKQQVENTNVNVSLAEYLKALDLEDSATIDITPAPNQNTMAQSEWDFL